MAWVNYHTHSHYCDGKAEPEAYLVKAIEKGFPACGYSSHAPVPFDTKWNMKQERLPTYLEEISRLREKYRGRIQVYTGLEVDYIGGLWGFHHPFFNNLKLDYTIGSVHFMDALSEGIPWTIDGSSEEFFRGFESAFHQDVRKLVTRYYELVREMVLKDSPTIIGHLDKIKMHNRHRIFLNEEEGWYRDCVEDTLDLIAAKGSIVEVNTRGTYRYDQPDLYPGKWILERIYRKKIPVMINADAHLPEEIDSGHVFAAGILQDIGFGSLRILWKNQWIDCAFTSTGVNIEDKA
jgi:histidinol-phosphatase (PHP family)